MDVKHVSDEILLTLVFRVRFPTHAHGHPGNVVAGSRPHGLVGEEGEGSLSDLDLWGRGGGLYGLLEGVSSSWSTERHDV